MKMPRPFPVENPLRFRLWDLQTQRLGLGPPYPQRFLDMLYLTPVFLAMMALPSPTETRSSEGVGFSSMGFADRLGRASGIDDRRFVFGPGFPTRRGDKVPNYFMYYPQMMSHRGKTSPYAYYRPVLSYFYLPQNSKYESNPMEYYDSVDSLDIDELLGSPKRKKVSISGSSSGYGHAMTTMTKAKTKKKKGSDGGKKKKKKNKGSTKWGASMSGWGGGGGGEKQSSVEVGPAVAEVEAAVVEEEAIAVVAKTGVVEVEATAVEAEATPVEAKATPVEAVVGVVEVEVTVEEGAEEAEEVEARAVEEAEARTV
ncbi:unnamed protein product, partial [Darwinula stevensoni]